MGGNLRIPGLMNVYKWASYPLHNFGFCAQVPASILSRTVFPSTVWSISPHRIMDKACFQSREKNQSSSVSCLVSCSRGCTSDGGYKQMGRRDGVSFLNDESLRRNVSGPLGKWSRRNVSGPLVKWSNDVAINSNGGGDCQKKAMSEHGSKPIGPILNFIKDREAYFIRIRACLSTICRI